MVDIKSMSAHGSKAHHCRSSFIDARPAITHYCIEWLVIHCTIVPRTNHGTGYDPICCNQDSHGSDLHSRQPRFGRDAGRRDKFVEMSKPYQVYILLGEHSS